MTMRFPNRQRPCGTLRGAFTLIEIMIVVIILGILAAIVIPAYQDYVVRSQVTEGVSLATEAKSAMWDFVSNKGRFPGNNASAGLPTATSISGTYVSKVDVSNGKITVYFNQPKSYSRIKTQTLVLSPITHGGSISWDCANNSTLAKQYLPPLCRN